MNKKNTYFDISLVFYKKRGLIYNMMNAVILSNYFKIYRYFAKKHFYAFLK